MNDYKVEKFVMGEEARISELIKTVFDEFVAPDYSAAGNKFFYAYIEPGKIVERFLQGSVVLTTQNNGNIIGVIELRDHHHICLLFVDKEWHGKGIAKRLLAKAVALSPENNKGMKYFEVNASPYSEKIYARMGFKKTSDIQDVNGLKFIPMKMELS
jgi:GNAT superfamily N-acetyltransferase